MSGLNRPLLLLLVVLLAGCATAGGTSPGGQQKGEPYKKEGFRLSHLAKSDVSFMADIAVERMEHMLRQMTIKLYRRNPRELKKAEDPDLKRRVESIFKHPGRLIFDDAQGKEEIYAMLLGMDPDFQGDRVFAIMVGLTGMIRRSYGYKHEFYMLDSLNGQALYNAARNIEVLSWRLRTRRDENGDLLLLTNSQPGEPENLSFERLFGEMIGLQDLMAELAASKQNRTITKVVQSVGSMVFLPVP